MERNILIFWMLVYIALWLLKRNPHSVISRAVFTWIGPLPNAGESWAQFQLRWAAYSFGWLCQFSLILTVIFVLALYFPSFPEEIWFKVLLFALPLGAGVGLLATVGFLFKAAKAYLFGPNPVCIGSAYGEHEA